MAVKKAIRPTSYNVRSREEVIQILERIIVDLKTDPDRVYVDDIISNNNIAIRTWHSWKNETYKDDEVIPMLYERIDHMIKEKLIRGGIGGTFNPFFAKFILSAKHEFVETTKQEVKADVNAVTSISIKCDGYPQDIDI